MEDVLEVYQRPHDPEAPVVCLDESSKQLIAETRVPIAAKPGHPARHDYEYERNGTANLFMIFAALEGWRHVEVTDRHTAVDYAHILKELSDTRFPAAKTIVLVQDNLNTHKPASLYEAFPAPEARRLVERFEWHYTPKHGSWLDLAESELSVLSGQCLDRRIPDKQTLIEEVAAWEISRNQSHTKADWRFTTANARRRPANAGDPCIAQRGTIHSKNPLQDCRPRWRLSVQGSTKFSRSHSSVGPQHSLQPRESPPSKTPGDTTHIEYQDETGT